MPKTPDPAQPLGPIPGLRPAGPADIKERLPQLVSMDYRWIGLPIPSAPRARRPSRQSTWHV